MLAADRLKDFSIEFARGAFDAHRRRHAAGTEQPSAFPKQRERAAGPHRRRCEQRHAHGESAGSFASESDGFGRGQFCRGRGH
jgi:hypothetical protein